MKKDTFDKTRIKGDDMKFNKETIRKYEDPEFKRAAEEYERMATGRRNPATGKPSGKKPQTNRAVRAGVKSRNAGQHKSLKDAERDEFQRQKKPFFGKNKKVKPAGESSRRSAQNNAYQENIPGNPKRRKKRKLNKKKVVRNIILLIVVLFAAFVIYFFGITSHLDKVDTNKEDFAIDSQVAKDLKGYRNIAILGVDARKGESLDGSRTDAIIIARIKKSNGDIQLISIMRDSYLKMADTDGQLILDKVTHAHHYGGGVDTCAALNRSLDLNIDEFIIFNWQAVSDTVDTLGGIEVDVKKNEIADLNKWGPETAENVGGTYTKITTTGKQTIDGVQATTYCRIRKTSGGDTGRGNRYKKVMSAVMKKAISSPLKLNKLAKEVLPEIRTNMSQLQLLTAVLRAPGYTIDKSYGWPKTYYGGLLGNGIWYAVPQTLETNVSWLHKKAFQQSGYTPSGTCQDISNEIIYYTGIQ